MGRHTILDEDLTNRICANLEIAMPLALAAEAEGIHRDTVYQWMRKGEAGEEPYEAFHQAVTRARARGARHLTLKAQAGGKGSHSATWFLERRYREDYGDIKRIEHAGHDGGAMQINIKPIHEMTDDELRAAIQSAGTTGGELPPGVS